MRDGVVLPVKPKAFELLAFLLRHPGQVFTRDQLLEKVWGYDYAGETRTVDVHVHWLRSQIEVDPRDPSFIHTVRGVGYVFRRPPDASGSLVDTRIAYAGGHSPPEPGRCGRRTRCTRPAPQGRRGVALRSAPPGRRRIRRRQHASRRSIPGAVSRPEPRTRLIRLGRLALVRRT